MSATVKGAGLNEWGFCGQIKSWWDAAAQDRYPSLGETQIEQQAAAGRADLTLTDAAGAPLLVLEMRLPDHAQPSAWDLDNITSAMGKASILGARWSATSDGHKFVLVDRHRPGSVIESVVFQPTLGVAPTRESLDVAAERALVKAEWLGLLGDLVEVFAGQAPAAIAPDELFIESLRALLARPVAAVRDAISARFKKDAEFNAGVIRWMVEEQGWQHSPQDTETEIGRVASVSAYVFTARLLFYEALRRKHPELPAPDLGGGHAVTAQAVVRAIFEHARSASGDYETVFTFDDVCRYALIDNAAVTGWDRVVQHLEQFKIDELGYDILGRLFERFIDPQERYNWGQHYTSPDVVDLMLSLAMPDGEGLVLDPAAGGGTFLVRGYVRKQILRPDEPHQQLLAELAGCDISAFAASLATVSLAARDLSYDQNYPRIHAGSFFRLQPGGAFMQIPTLGGDHKLVTVDDVDAVVSNPPYIAARHTGDARREEAAAALGESRRHHTPGALSGKPNYHLYFWFHAAHFLKPGGRLVFITSGEWLDSDYGAQLQRWLLANTRIDLVVESMAEAWFSEARVGTVVLSATVDDHTVAPQDRDNPVRFVTLRAPLRGLYGCVAGESDLVHIGHVDALRDRLSTVEGLAETDDLDWAVVSQGELWGLGVQ
jgi:hypothetical protein